MTTTVQISVTKDDIDAANDGILVRCCECPVARACDRALQRPVKVYPSYIYDMHNRVIAELPATARTFIRRFDAGEPVEPIVFELEVDNAH